MKIRATGWGRFEIEAGLGDFGTFRALLQRYEYLFGNGEQRGFIKQFLSQMDKAENTWKKEDSIKAITRQRYREVVDKERRFKLEKRQWIKEYRDREEVLRGQKKKLKELKSEISRIQPSGIE